MIEPGKLVMYRQDIKGKRTATKARVIDVVGETSIIQKNGSLFEVPTQKLRTAPACEHCGKQADRLGARYCSAKCFHESRFVEVDAIVFDAIVKYKSEHDGLSPTTRQLGAILFYDKAPILRAIRRLTEAGKIRTKGAKSSGIEVVGGRWTYEPPPKT
jgi:hypothetical protein